ncbi:MAG TPA: T9SS type A sorting domain-containing protein [Saprospiraceae bacterium]|nr:T9SS type A sorting domain-containing protein [Saprospiraceae bacterium]
MLIENPGSAHKNAQHNSATNSYFDNSTSISFSVDIMDDVAPAFGTVPKDAKVICQQLPPAPPVFANDPAQPVSVVYAQIIGPINGQGAYDVTRKWTATDACGNSSEAIQHITWIPDTGLECDISVPASVNCNTHGVTVSAAASSGLGGVSFAWEVIGEECFIQSGQGTPDITLYVGFSEVEIVLTLTDGFGCSTVCSASIDCIISAPSPFAGSPQSNDPKANSIQLGIISSNDQHTAGYLTQVNLWPNPANGTLNLSFESGMSQEINFRLINFLGQVSLIDKINARDGYNAEKIDIAHVPDGSYLMEVKTDRDIYTKMVVILRNQ